MYSIMAVCSVPGLIRDCSCVACRFWHAQWALKKASEMLESLAEQYTVSVDDVGQVAEYLHSALEVIDELTRQDMKKGGTDADSESQSQ